MIRFMVLSAPRSGSTWVSNWLTTDRSLCLHDPILEYTVDELDKIESDRTLGISCTALALLPAFVNAHPARKVVVHRDMAAVNCSLETIGATKLGPAWHGALEQIGGMHVAFEDLFKPIQAKKIYEYLLERPFDVVRHQFLMGVHVEPEFSRLPIRPGRAKDFVRRMTEDLDV